MRISRWRRAALAAVVLAVVSAFLAPDTPVAQSQQTRPAGWSDSTHGPSAAPDYGRLFAMDKVHELRITIAPERFREMQDDLNALVPAGRGFPGFGGRPGGPGGAGGPAGGGGAGGFAALMEAGVAACSGKAAAAPCSAGGIDGQCSAFPPGGDALMCVPAAMAGAIGGLMGGGALRMIPRDPIYVPVTVAYDGRAWTSVGMRYKGNSSLMAGASGGIGKIPFRLDFDRYEAEAPETRNQRFYGFQELTFSSNFTDESQIRELLATEIFRDRGVPAPRGAFYRIVVDAGAGPEYWGLYSMIEDPGDGAMLASQLGGRDGNLYKPDGPGADWTRFTPEGFPKKTNESRADFSDVSAAIAALHAPTTDRAVWRAGLEKTFDVDLFLRWLAVNTAIENWDTYGALAHNYYLYGDPAAGGRLRWIPWDNNMAFGMGPGGGFGRGGRGGPGGFPGLPGGSADLLHRQAGQQWPLIQRLMADDVYAARYRRSLAEATEGLNAPAALASRARQMHGLITPAVLGERPSHTTVSSRAGFEGAIDGPGGLVESTRRRHDAVRAALAGPPSR